MKNQNTLPIVVLLLLSVACACPSPSSRNSSGSPAPQSASNAPSTPKISEVEVVSAKWQKSGFGTVAVWKVTIKNNTDTPIGDIKFKTEYESETGNIVGRGGTNGFIGKDTIEKIVPAKNLRTFEVNDGFVSDEAVKGSFNIVSWRKME